LSRADRGTHNPCRPGRSRGPQPQRGRIARQPSLTSGAQRRLLGFERRACGGEAADASFAGDLGAGRRLLDASLPALGTVKAIVADRGYRGLGKMANMKGIRLDIKAPPKGTVGFTPIAPLYRVEHAFARLGRWRRLSRCHEGTPGSARAWLEVASLGYLFARLRVEPA
jgi:hypothetical protein